MHQPSVLHQLSPAPLLFLPVPRSPLGLFLREVLRLVASKPEILAAIGQDLELDGLKNKSNRLRDQNWVSNDQLTIPGMNQIQTDENVTLSLQVGRPRMTAVACYFFWMLSTYAGGIKSRKMRDLLQDSISVMLFCQEAGIQIPSGSTLADNISVLSDETRHILLDAQIAHVKEEGLDDFDKCQFDSTMVEANIAWPTDSALILKIIRLVNVQLKKMRKLGLTGVDCDDTGTLIKHLKSLDFKINCTPNNKPDVRKALYDEFLEDAEEATPDFNTAVAAYALKLGEINLRPSKIARLTKILGKVKQSLHKLDLVIQHCHERVYEEMSRPVNEKVLSVSDPDAAYMKKGSRDPKIGYHPQLARSEKGLVTAVIVPKGYTGDASELQPLCEQSFRRTGVVPTGTSGDGCYASKANRKWLLEKGVKNPSFSSSKGKAITPLDEWRSETCKHLRNWRSAAEALMSQIKNQLNFGHPIKRGLESVRAELTDKVLAFNFLRMAFLRTQ